MNGPGREGQGPTVADLQLCFEGAVPAVIATASADGLPNVTYLSRVQMVDEERVALSNQFFSKTARNLAENPRASILLIDPVTYDQWRLTLVYERTERRGPVFERLREDVDTLAALQRMQDVFKLRAADVYRVVAIDQVLADAHRRGLPSPVVPEERAPDPVALAELMARQSRAGDLDLLVSATVDGLAEILGYGHSSVLLLDETGTRLYTIASHGYDAQGIGSEVAVGDGVPGMAAVRCSPIRIGNARQMAKYSATVRRSFEDQGTIGPDTTIPVPGLDRVESQMAVPAMALGELVGVLLVESSRPVAFSATDVAVLTSVASLLAAGVVASRGVGRPDDVAVPPPPPSTPAAPSQGGVTTVRFYDADGSTFLGGDYLIKGVAGRILWSLLQRHRATGQVDYTNREVRLDPSLDLPAFRDNLESRLILLKRRLDERDAPVRIERTGRGRFRMSVSGPLELTVGGSPPDGRTVPQSRT